MVSIARFFPVTESEKLAIIGEFGKAKENVKEDIAILREWLKKQPHIPNIKDDSLLEQILIRNKFRIEKTKFKIDSYFTSKHVYADYFDALDPSTDALIKATNITFSAFMPKLLSPDHKRIHYWSIDPTSKIEDFDFKSIVRYGTILNESQMLFDYCPAIVSIFDTKGMRMAHSFNFDLAIQAKMFKLFFEAFSGQVSMFHIVNVFQAAEFFVNLLKPLLPEKIRNRIQLHSSLDSLHKLIPKEHLPIELGGTENSAIELAREFASTLRLERDYIIKRNKTSTNEKCRIGEPPIQTDMFGVDGTFKKIILD